MLIPDQTDAASDSLPRLLYVGEYPPSNHHGGAILLRRLLGSHPPGRLAIVASRPGIAASQSHDLLPCLHVVVPAWKAPGVLRLASGLLQLGLVTASTVKQIRRRQVQVVITIVQGRFYIAGALAAWATGTLHITIVHDNFLSKHIGPSGLARTWKRRLTRTIIQRADHVYTVSPEMQRLVQQECHAPSEIQLPSTAAPVVPASTPESNPKHEIILLFAGLISYTVKDCLELLVTLIKNGELQAGGLPLVKLQLCTSLSGAELRDLGWDHPNIFCRGWLPSNELASALASADILFLPYSFTPAARDAVETAFPSKTADYLAAAKPLLILGPAYSSLVRYASKLGFAEVVNEFSPAALALGIRNISGSQSYRAKLAARSLEVFAANHDIASQQRRFYKTLRKLIRCSLESASAAMRGR